jgi:hypothetical protein
VTAAASGPGSLAAGASVVMAAMMASRAAWDSVGSRSSSGTAISASVVPLPAAWTRFAACFGPDARWVTGQMIGAGGGVL